MIKSQYSYSRIIGVLPLNNSVLTRTRNFVPDYAYTDNFVDTHYFDEIVILKIDSDNSENSLHSHGKAISRLMEKSALPLTLGGNIRSVSDAVVRFDWGADRILIGESLLSRSISARQLVSRYGSQALVGCINYDSKQIAINSNYRESLLSRAVDYQRLGMGELMLTAVDRDGTLQGFDTCLSDYIANKIEIPIVLNGGLGNWMHVEEVFSKENVAGVCTSNILHLSTSAIKSMKQNLLSRGRRIRPDFTIEHIR